MRKPKLRKEALQSRRRERLRIIEQLEPRLLLNTDWQNPARPLDVNNDRRLSALDALLVINRLNDPVASRVLPQRTNPLDRYFDTSGDGRVSAIDALRVINELNSHSRDPIYAGLRIEGESEVAPAGFISIPMMVMPGGDRELIELTSSLSINTQEFNEMGLFVVDDTDGRVDGIPPSSPDYGRAVFESEHRRVLYSRADIFRSSNAVILPAGRNVHVYVLQASTDNGDPTAHLRVRQTSSSNMRIGWEEHASMSGWPSVGDRGYDDVIVDVQLGTPYPGREAPVIEEIPNQSHPEQTELVITPIVTDADLPDDTLTFSLDIAPPGATIDSSTGRFRWTPTEEQGPGNYEVILRATDRDGLFSTESFFVTVLEVNRPPVLQPIEDQDVEPGTLLTVYLDASDPDIPANLLTYSLGNNAPVGTMIDSATGRFDWIAPVVSTTTRFPITVRVTDNGSPSLSATQTFTVTVAPRFESCPFDDQLSGWTTIESGGTATGRGTVVPNSCTVTITEGDSFVVGLERSFTIPDEPTAIDITITGLNFDSTDTGFIRDAFEIALVDKDGNPLVAPFTAGRDVLFNITEGMQPAVAQGISYVEGSSGGGVGGSTSDPVIVSRSVFVGLNGIPPGTEAKIILRLANDDSDTITSVTVSQVKFVESDMAATAPNGQRLAERQNLTSTIPNTSQTANPASIFVPGPSDVEPLPNTWSDSVLNSSGKFIYETSADFQQGQLFNLNTTDVIDQLSLNRGDQLELFPFIWVSNSGEGTVSKFDVRSGNEVGRYRTGTLGAPDDPSRTAVDSDGNGWIANRAANRQASIVKVLNTSFIDRNNNGEVDSSFDANGDGQISASERYNWDSNSDGQPDDERIGLWIQVGRNRQNPNQLQSNAIARAIAIDADDNVWVGLYNLRQYEVYDGSTGELIAIVPTTGRPYGAVVDANGQLWSANRESYVERIDTVSRTYQGTVSHGGDNYGITVGQDGIVWTVTYSGNRLVRIDPNTNEVRTYTASGVGQYRGVAVDLNGNVWAASNSPNALVKFTFESDGVTLRSTQRVSVNGTATAAAVDTDGFIWTTTTGTNLIWKVDPDTVTVVPGWPKPTGTNPYNYSDMTGSVRLGVTQRSGTWTEIVDSSRLNAAWAGVEITANLPSDTSLSLRVRTSNLRDTLAAQSWLDVQPNQPLPGIIGRFLEVETRLRSQDPDQHPTIDRITVQAAQPPQVIVSQPKGLLSREPGVFLLSGQALADRPVIDGKPFSNDIMLVTVNNIPVQQLDKTGNFFTSVDVQPGINRYEVTAHDRYGQTGTYVAYIQGVEQSAIDFSRYSDITGSFSGRYFRTSFNEQAKLLHVDLATRNDGQFTSDVPLLVGVKNISDPGVSLVGFDGFTPDGIPYYDYSAFVAGGRLGPGQLTQSPTVLFHNPQRVQFDYELVFYGQLNQAPYFTSVPRLEALAGRTYTYDADAIDPDDDPLSYSLLVSPTGMSINASSGLITWNPTQQQIGQHDVTVQVSDGRGGFAEQRYTIIAIEPPPNRPPVITSTPLTSVTASDSENTVGLSGKAIISNDEWTLSNTGFSQSPEDTAEFVSRVTDYFTGGTPGRFLAYSNNFSLTGSRLAETMAALGHEWVVSTEVEFSATNLRQFDAVFLAGFSADNSVLSEYLNSGGNVYLSAGTGLLGSATQEASTWNAFLESIGLQYGNSFNGINGVIPLPETPHPVFPGLNLYQANGNSISDLDEFDELGFLVASQRSNGLFAVYDGRFVGSAFSYRYDVQAIDPDFDTLQYRLLEKPSGMWIDPDTGVVRWLPSQDHIGDHTVVVEASDGRGGIATQEFNVCVHSPAGSFRTPHVVDLEVDSVVTSDVVYDAQLLAVSGEILATILNRGPNSTPAAFAVSFFEDRNLNRQYDPTIDALVGSTVIRHPLAGGETATVTASLSGQVLFAGSPVYAFVDSTNAIEETIESNNVGRDLHEFVPAVGVFDPQLEWAWTSSSIQPSSLNVMNTPVVIDLNQDGTPDVVFGSTASTGGGSVEVGIVRALNGLNGTELFSIANSDFLINTAASLAAGDIDGDGVPEIIATDSSGSRLIAFNNSGDFLWRTPQLESINWGAPALADLDNDGSIEIIIGRQVINNDGTLRWTGAGGRAYVAGPISLVADVDLNGSPEIVAGNTLYNSQGSIIWQNNIPDGHNAIGNFDDDDYAEIVLVSGGNVYLFEHNGTLKWGPVGIPGGGSGGPPTVADYDGDGEPEVGVAGARRYVVLETDGSIKWQSVTQDASSNVTGSSVFDFEGDGRAEVVYRDELRLRVYDGIDGTVRWEVPMSSCTWHEYAYVVDVDGDGNAEILTTANNNCGLGPQRGVFVYGSASDSWVDTRDIWNQHTYHINNVNDDGTIPQIEQPSWLTHNSYRLNTLTDAVSVRLAPDLTASWLRIAQSESDVQLTARIGNGGSTFSPAGVSVAFYNGNPTVGGTLLGTTNVGRLDPGCFQDISFTVPADGVTDIWVVADDDGAGRGTVGESSETNNILHAGLALQPVNQEPTITSTPLLNAVEGRVYSYNVTADDPDVNLPITYSLHVAPNGMQIDVGAGEITWTPDSRDSGSHAVQVIATDARGGRAIQVFAVTVAGDLNTSPEITSSAVTVANVGEMYRYSLMAIDAEGDDLTYSLLSAPAGMRIYPDFGIVEWIPLHEQLGIHGVTIRVEDGQGGADIQVFEITATKPNTPPIFSSTPPSTAVLNRPLKYQVRLQDADSDSITVTLADGSVGNLVQRERGYYFEWTPTDSDVTAGTRSVTILANDGLGGVSEQTFSLAVLASSTNAAPVITSTPRTVAYPGGTYNYYVTANDPDRDRLVFELIEGPTGMTISSEGLVAWSPTGDVGQSYVVQIVVSDGQGGSTEQEFDLQIASQLVNTAPVIASNPPWTARDGRAYVYDAQAVDAEGDPVRWSLDTAPIGMSVDADTGQVRWIPSNDQLGMHSVTLRAFDPLGASTVQSFSINTMCANTPPLITSTPLTQAFVGDPYFYAVRAVDPDGDPLEFSLVSGPAGLTISSAGLIRWTPSAIDEGQQRSVAVRADDGQGGFVIQQYQIAVAPATSQNRPPVITSTPEFSVTVGDTYDYIVTAIDPDGDTLVYSLLVKPDWMSIDPQTGAITGTAVSVGAESVVVQVSDGTSVATQGFSVNVRLNSAPVITSPPITSITAGGTYRYTVRANDPDGDPLTYRLTQAPDGMTIDQNGRIVWSATAGVTAPQPVTVTVSDDRGQTATQSYSITMLADTEAPRVFLSVYTSDSAFGSQATLNIGAVYTVQVSATDNVGVQTVGLMVDGQAVTLTANGTVTLTASSLGTVQLLAFATDAAGLRGEASGSATISNPGQGFQPNPSDPGLPPNPGPDPSDSGQPIVEITSPEPGTAVTNRVPIIGTVDDPENNLWYYRAYYARADRVSITNIDLEDADWTVFHQSTQEVINGELAVFDASNLTNDAYAIIVAGFDVNGRGYAAPTLVYVEGNLVLGNFRLEFTDLSIPLVGIPIQVSRVYDTLNAQDEGDFGFGWTLGVQDARIVEALAIGPGGAFNGGNNKFVPDKTKVYLTNPFGKRVGFTYKEQLLSASLFGGIWRPYFEPDPGVYDTLTIDETQVARGGIIGALAQGINPSNYTLTTREGMKYRYSDTQGLQTITDRNGNVVTYTSSGIRHSSGQEIQFVRDHRGRIKQIVDPLGNTIVYTFSHEGDLVLVRDQVDAITNFAYRSDVPHYLDSVTDPFGRVGVRTEYNQDGRLTRFIDINGRPTSFEYDPQALLEERIDGLGNKHIILYDSQGNIARYVDPLGNETFFEYDESNNLTRRTDALGNTTTHTYDSLGNRLSTTTAHSSDQNPADFTTTFTYNSRGQQTSVIGPSGGGIFLEYDNRGNQTKIIDIDGSVIAFSEFDAAGNEVKSGDMLGFTTYVYDSAGNAIETTDSNGDTYFAEYDASGQVTVLTYEDGRQYERTYDGKGRVLTEGFIGGNKTTYKYENGDDWVSFSDEQIGEVTRLTNGDGSFRGWSIDGVDQLQIEYNAAGQATVETDAAGNETKYEYDPSGRLTSVTGPTDAKSTREYDAAGRIIRETDAAGHSTRFTYDQSGRLASVTNALDHRWDYSYTTNSVTIEDPLGNRTTSLLTPDGLHAGTVLPDGRRTSTDYLLRSQLADAEEYPTRVIATDGRMTLYGYDGNGNLETVTLSDGATYRYSYGTDTILYRSPNGDEISIQTDDVSGRETITFPDGGVQTLFYQSSSGAIHVQPVTVTQPSGTTISNLYSSNEALVQRTTSTGIDHSFEYDVSGSLTTYSDATGETRQFFDQNNQLIRIEYPNGGSIAYGRNILGQITRIDVWASTVGAALTTTYAYDPVGNITRIDDPKEGTTNLRYDALNRLIEQSLPNGVVGTFSYDSTSRITDVRYATTSGTLVSMDYEFGLTSAPERITFEDGSYLEYEFDDAFRLSKEEFFSAIDQVMASYLYEYDSVGNRDQTSRNGITTQSEFGPGGKLVSSQSNSTNTAYSYDEDGRLRASNVDGVMTEYEFDALDQLVEVLLPESQGSVEYTYDALGRRVAARHGNTSVQYIVGPTLVEELESPHLATNRDGELIAGFAYFGEVPLVRYSATETIYYLTDPQGSVVGLTDQDGNLVARFKYTGFGELLTAEGSAAETPQELLGDYRFHGGWLEGKSNLYTFRDRVYDPVIGQFMSRDPVDADEFDPVTFSTYSYARNNPLAFRDPTGQIAIIGYAFKLAKTLIVAEAIDFVTGVISTQLVIPALRLVVPGFENSLLDRFIRGEGSRDFEKLMKQAICSGLGLVNADGFAWFEPRMTDKGRPVSNGTTCGEVNPAEESNRPPGLVRPDFLFSNSEPKKVGKSASHPPRSLVVGDFTLKLSSKLSKPRQLKVIRNHALRYQYVPVAVYFAFNAKRVDVVKMQSKFLPVKVFIFGVF